MARRDRDGPLGDLRAAVRLNPGIGIADLLDVALLTGGEYLPKRTTISAGTCNLLL